MTIIVLEHTHTNEIVCLFIFKYINEILPKCLVWQNVKDLQCLSVD